MEKIQLTKKECFAILKRLSSMSSDKFHNFGIMGLSTKLYEFVKEEFQELDMEWKKVNPPKIPTPPKTKEQRLADRKAKIVTQTLPKIKALDAWGNVIE